MLLRGSLAMTGGRRRGRQDTAGAAAGGDAASSARRLAVVDDLAGDPGGWAQPADGADDVADEERLELKRAPASRVGGRVDPHHGPSLRVQGRPAVISAGVVTPLGSLWKP
jgi:hypothetical protein